MEGEMRRIAIVRWGFRLTFWAALCLGLAVQESEAGSARGSSGGFSTAIPIRVPTFRGIEPAIVLGYSSQSRGGFAGVGWSLGGFGTVERASPGLGSPRYDATDVFVLNGQELLPCPAPNPSPSCTAGGTHTTKSESDLKIRFDAGTNTWTVWAKSGVKTFFSPVYQTPSGTLTWGQSSVTDTHGNVVSYTWACPSGDDCYPDTVTFAPYTVTLYRETRGDVTSRATGHAATLRFTRSRLRSVLVTYAGLPVRAYRLSYGTSPVTSRSLLLSVQEYGRDVAIDAAGAISGGTALPPYVFEYQDDPLGQSFQRWGE
jgi:hypothetical protein